MIFGLLPAVSWPEGSEEKNHRTLEVAGSSYLEFALSWTLALLTDVCYRVYP